MRKVMCGVLAAILMVLATAGAAEPAQAFSRTANERTLLKLINHARSVRHLAPLRLQPVLDRAALSHSREMVSRDYFSHSSAGGTSYAARLCRAGYKRSGYGSWAVSEVIGWGRGTRGTPQAVFRAWMKSAYHRRAILGKRWRDVGVGCTRGSFCGLSGSVVYTVDLGRRTR